MTAAILRLLEARKMPAFAQFIRNYRARTIGDLSVPQSPEEAMRMGFEMGWQQGYGKGLAAGVDLGVDVGMGAISAATAGMPFDPGHVT